MSIFLRSTLSHMTSNFIAESKIAARNYSNSSKGAKKQTAILYEKFSCGSDGAEMYDEVYLPSKNLVISFREPWGNAPYSVETLNELAKKEFYQSCDGRFVELEYSGTLETKFKERTSVSETELNRIKNLHDKLKDLKQEQDRIKKELDKVAKVFNEACDQLHSKFGTSKSKKTGSSRVNDDFIRI